MNKNLIIGKNNNSNNLKEPQIKQNWINYNNFKNNFMKNINKTKIKASVEMKITI